MKGQATQVKLGMRPLSIREPSAERPLEVDYRMPRALLGWQVKFITCAVADTTHSGCHYLLVYSYKLDPGRCACHNFRA